MQLCNDEDPWDLVGGRVGWETVTIRCPSNTFPVSFSDTTDRCFQSVVSANAARYQIQPFCSKWRGPEDNGTTHTHCNSPVTSSLDLFGHIAPMDDNADAKRILSTLPPEDWRRPRGHPRTTWLSTVQQDLEIPWSHTAWSNGYDPEPVSVEDVVDVRHYTVVSCMPEMTTILNTLQKSCAYAPPLPSVRLGSAHCFLITSVDCCGKIFLHRFRKKTTRYLIAHNFCKCWPIFKIFHPRAQWCLCNEVIIKNPITPQMHRYTTLWNVNIFMPQWLSMNR